MTDRPVGDAAYWDGPGVPVALDITDADQVAAAARRCADVTLLVNNAGVMALSPLIGAPTAAARPREDLSRRAGQVGRPPELIGRSQMRRCRARGAPIVGGISARREVAHARRPQL